MREMLLATGYPERAPALRPRPGGADAARAPRPARWRCCAWTPTGTSRPAPRWSTCTRGSRAGGVLIIDDYGHWEGARKAVDEYFEADGPAAAAAAGSTTRAGSPSSTEARRAPRAPPRRRSTFSGVTPSRRSAARAWPGGARGRPRGRAVRTGSATACSPPGPRSAGSPAARARPPRPPGAEHVVGRAKPSGCSWRSSAGAAPARRSPRTTFSASWSGHSSRGPARRRTRERGAAVVAAHQRRGSAAARRC